MTKALSIGARWFEKGSTLRIPTNGAKLMKLKLDLVSMLLVNINGRSPIPKIKKGKTREDSASVRLAENTPMLKSNYKFSNEVSHNSFRMFHVSLPQFSFPFYSLLQVGAVMSVNAVLSVFLLRGTWQ